MTKRVRLEYGDAWIDVEVPESAVVVRPGETYQDPPPLDNPVTATREALANSLGAPRIEDMVGPGCRVVIAGATGAVPAVASMRAKLIRAGRIEVRSRKPPGD